MPDVEVQNEGTIFLFRMLTDAAREWADEHIDPEAPRIGDAIAAEHRYAGDLAGVMMRAGLEVK